MKVLQLSWEIIRNFKKVNLVCKLLPRIRIFGKDSNKENALVCSAHCYVLYNYYVYYYITRIPLGSSIVIFCHSTLAPIFLKEPFPQTKRSHRRSLYAAYLSFRFWCHYAMSTTFSFRLRTNNRWHREGVEYLARVSLSYCLHLQ